MSQVQPSEGLDQIAIRMSESSRNVFAELARTTAPATHAASVSAALAAAQPGIRAFNIAGDALKQMTRVGSMSSVLESLNSVNVRYSDLMKDIALPDHMFANVLLAQDRLAETVARLNLSSSAAVELAQIDMSRFVSASMAAQFTLSAIETSAVGGLLGATNAFQTDALENLTRLTTSYDSLMQAAMENTQLLSAFPAAASRPAVDYYRQVELLESVTVPDDQASDFEVVELGIDDSAVSVDDLLAQMDALLVPILHGARVAIESSNPDRGRHVMVSLRELVSAVIHGLAPDESVKRWTDDQSHYHNGRPTRRARILYACRDLESSPLERFLEDDIRAAISFIDFLNSETHVRQSDLSTRHLAAAVARAEALLVFLLQLPRQ